MFNLNDNIHYWLYSEPTDMRKSFYSLSGIVSNSMDRNPLNGDAYIFINKSLNRMKILRMERGGFVLYIKMLEIGRFHRPKLDDDCSIYWRDLVLLVEGIVEKKNSRIKRFNISEKRQEKCTLRT